MARLEGLEPSRSASYRRKPIFLSRLLTLAAYSPFLAETMLTHPEHMDWLERNTERDFDRVKSIEQLAQELARFTTGLTGDDPLLNLSRFKRRELLRIYLRDCLGIATLAELTEELSNLADVVLIHALGHAMQRSLNQHGAPSTRDERGRLVPAELAVVALGKLGCRELNYASDIDLLFLYSGQGETAGDGGRQAVVGNKEFFSRVAEYLIQMIGGNKGEGAVYRIDLRLRPYGRDGDVVWEIGRAADYYRNTAQDWERQALLRARASAGSETAMTAFLDSVRDVIFAPEALPNTFLNVRRAKEAIDRKIAGRGGGFNVKLGRGGIREIEFIAQALQLQYGGQEPWLRSAHTLIILARLAEKGYLTESERACLSAAYTFLRRVEHRLQMEHGAQTHTLPLAQERLELLARRCGYHKNQAPLPAFERDLTQHTAAVRAVYERVFATGGAVVASGSAPIAADLDDETERLIHSAAAALARLVAPQGSSHLKTASPPPLAAHALAQMISRGLGAAINGPRSLRNLLAWVQSLATYDEQSQSLREWVGSEAVGAPFIERLLAALSSQYLSHILISRPAFAAVIAEGAPRQAPKASAFLKLMEATVGAADGVAAKTDALRRAWYQLVVEIGAADMIAANPLPPLAGGPDTSLAAYTAPPATRRALDALRANNLAQTALAEVSLHMALQIALQSPGVFHAAESSQVAARPVGHSQKGLVESPAAATLPFTILALGRLGHAGMDYGSDLDLLMVFDDEAGGSPEHFTFAASTSPASPFDSPQEFYSKLTSQVVGVLSSITREGFLYRVDLRLRPEGKNGLLAQGLSSLLGYLTERASAWEHSAYLKVREVAGNLQFGARARGAICDAVFARAAQNQSLKEDLAAMRSRIEREKAGPGRPNIKQGRGGMTDVYFVTRYLQLRDRVYFPPEQGTAALIKHLGEYGSLDAELAEPLFAGYLFLRRLDHWMRLLLDRPTSVLPASSAALHDIMRSLGLPSVDEFEDEYCRQTTAIRNVYDRVFSS